MDDILVKFNGKEVAATGVGGKNPVAAMIAQMMLSGQEYGVSQTQEVAAQSVGAAATKGGIAIG